MKELAKLFELSKKKITLWYAKKNPNTRWFIKGIINILIFIILTILIHAI